MTLLLKDPGARIDYAVDWGAEYLETDSLADSAWSVSPSESGGLLVAADSFAGAIANVTVSGGIAGHVYTLSNEVELVSGRRDRRSFVLRVEAR